LGTKRLARRSLAVLVTLLRYLLQPSTNVPKTTRLGGGPTFLALATMERLARDGGPSTQELKVRNDANHD
jgi:hypothetical protein